MMYVLQVYAQAHQNAMNLKFVRMALVFHRILAAEIRKKIALVIVTG